MLEALPREATCRSGGKQSAKRTIGASLVGANKIMGLLCCKRRPSERLCVCQVRLCEWRAD